MKSHLLDALRAGDYRPRQRLPGERILAKRYGVSHMTARRAVSELVQEQWLERRQRSGTFVHPGVGHRLAQGVVHLVCTTYDSVGVREFLRLGRNLIQEHGWTPRIERVAPHDVKELAASVRAGGYWLMLGESYLKDPQMREAVEAATGRIVIIGVHMSDPLLPSVLCDDAQGVRLAMEHLIQNGHRRMMLVSDLPERPVEALQIAIWRQYVVQQLGEDADLNGLFVSVNTPAFECPHRFGYEAMRNRLDAGPLNATALACTTSDTLVGVAGALSEAGIRVPDDLSLISLHDSSLARFNQPPTTAVDVDLQAHIASALDMIHAMREGQLGPADQLHLIEPRLVIRASVAEARTPRDQQGMTAASSSITHDD